MSSQMFQLASILPNVQYIAAVCSVAKDGTNVSRDMGIIITCL